LIENGSRTFAAEVAKALAVEEPTLENGGLGEGL
jgi:hypothetical protein